MANSRPPPWDAAHGHELRYTPIRSFLAGQTFEPESITTMSQALERVCGALRLRRIDDSATRRVAEKIIELTRWGIRDADTLVSLVLKDL